ncbi:MAG: hypothetical protein AAF909_07760 [Pseudomonadota bacterium]
MAVVLFAAACAQTAPYRPASSGASPGFSDRKIETDRYQVAFRGDSRTPREDVETYLLYRAAEVTVAEGGALFQVVTSDTTANTRYRTSIIGTRFGYSPFRYSSFGSLSTFGDIRPVTRYEAVANILVLDGERPARDGSVYDARDVLRTLGPSVRRPTPPSG